jgi:hypothetical protein
MHIVEVRRRNADLAAAMAQMRTWLDDQKIATFSSDWPLTSYQGLELSEGILRWHGQ